MAEEATGIREAFTITPAGDVKERHSRVSSESLTLLESKEREFGSKAAALFGTQEKPKYEFASFEPAFVIDDNTTLEALKPAITEALKSGIGYWRSLKNTDPYNLAVEQNLTLYERALDYVGVGGNRNSPKSFLDAVDQMSAVAVKQAESQTEQRVDDLYKTKSGEGLLILGKLAYGKLGVLWDVGGSQIYKYGEAYGDHIGKVRSFISTKA